MCRNSLLRQYETFIAVQLFVHRQTQPSFFCFVLFLARLPLVLPSRGEGVHQERKLSF